MTRWLVVAALAACSGGKDGPSLAQLHAKHAPVIEAKLVNLERIAKAPLPAATGKIALSGPMLRWTSHTPDGVYGNATLAFDVDSADLRSSGRTNLRTSNIDIINDCVTAAREKLMAGRYYSGTKSAPQENELVVTQALSQCAHLRYLVVAKVEAEKGTEYVDKDTFVGGAVAASALVFDLDTGAYLGGVPVLASSSERAYDPGSDLAVNFYRAIDEALNKAIPGAKLPYDRGEPSPLL